MISRQAIHTKFIGPSNVLGSRYKATCQAGSLTFSADHRLNPENNHARVAQALATKMGWDGKWYAGGLPDGTMCFVLADTRLSEAPEAFTI